MSKQNICNGQSRILFNLPFYEFSVFWSEYPKSRQEHILVWQINLAENQCSSLWENGELSGSPNNLASELKPKPWSLGLQHCISVNLLLNSVLEHYQSVPTQNPSVLKFSTEMVSIKWVDEGCSRFIFFCFVTFSNITWRALIFHN